MAAMQLWSAMRWGAVVQYDASVAVEFVIRDAALLERVRSPVQDVTVHMTRGFGKVLSIDGDLMLTERDHHGYHEMLAHVPLALLPGASHVLIIGGGDGGVCTEVIKYSQVLTVTVVDIDPAVTTMARRHFPALAACFDDPRVSLVHEDGAAWAERQLRERPPPVFDLAIVDATDFGASQSLRRELFFRHLAALLRDAPHRSRGKAALVLNFSSMAWNVAGLQAALWRQAAVFRHVRPYQVFQPTYMSGHYGLLLCSNSMELWAADGVLPTNPQAHAVRTRYYSPEVHVAAFALPRALREEVAAALRLPQQPAPVAARPGCGAQARCIETDMEHALGAHVVLELWGVGNSSVLDDSEALSTAMVAAATSSGLTVVNQSFHQFAPQGVTGVLLLSESHMSIHTWPELAYAAVDVFACNQTGSLVPLAGLPAAAASTGRRQADPWKAARMLAEALGAQSFSTQWLLRGIPRDDAGATWLH